MAGVRRKMVEGPSDSNPVAQIADDGTGTNTLENKNAKAAVSGYASLDGSSLVVQDPENATETPTAGKIAKYDGSGKLDSAISAASTTTPGLVKLAGSFGGTSTVPIVMGGDPWAYAKGNEVFNDEFTTFTTGGSPWHVCTDWDPRTAERATDSSVSFTRAIGANPAFDIATRSSTLLVQPANNTPTYISIYQTLPVGWVMSGTWTWVTKFNIPIYQAMAATGTHVSLGVCKPSATSLRDEAVSLYALSVSAGSVLTQTLYQFTANTGTSLGSYTITERIDRPTDIWVMLLHKSGSTTVYGFISNDGKTWSEIGSGAKDPTPFTTLYMTFMYQKAAGASTYAIYGCDYSRAYASELLR